MSEPEAHHRHGRERRVDVAGIPLREASLQAGHGRERRMISESGSRRRKFALALMALTAAGFAVISWPDFDKPVPEAVILPLLDAAHRCYQPSDFARHAAATAHILIETDRSGVLLVARLVSSDPIGTVGYIHARTALRAVRNCAPYDAGKGRTVLTFDAKRGRK